MNLMETKLKVEGYKRTTRKHFFCDLRVGDIVHIELEPPCEGRNKRTKFIPYFKIRCDENIADTLDSAHSVKDYSVSIGENMNLKSSSYRVIGIKKKTRAKWWADLHVGHIVHFRMDIEKKGGASNGLYATYITCVNQTKQTTFDYSQTQMVRYLDQFELSPVVCF